MKLLGLAALLAICGCARILSYDEYQPRAEDDATPLDAPLDAPLDGGGTAVGDALEDAGPPPARVPARPAGPAVASGSGKTLWLAVRSYTYGATDPSGATSAEAWRQYGYDLDEICTTARDSAENNGTCLRPAGAKQDSLIDGERCRDNNFGRNLARLLATLPDGEKTLNGLIREGSTTWILRVDDLDPGADDAFAPGAFFRSSDDRTSTPPPAWDGSDERGVRSDSLVDGDLARPVLVFPRGYVSGGTWVSGEPEALSLVAPISSVGFFPLKIQHARFTLDLDPLRTTAPRGLLVGAVAAPDLEPAYEELADFLRVCPGTALYDNTLASLRETPDVVIGAPNLQDTSRTCDGASAAVSLELTPIRPVTRVVAPPPPRKRRCGDAG